MIAALGRGQVAQEFKASLSLIVDIRLSWVTEDPVLKQRNRKKGGVAIKEKLNT